MRRFLRIGKRLWEGELAQNVCMWEAQIVVGRICSSFLPRYCGSAGCGGGFDFWLMRAFWLVFVGRRWIWQIAAPCQSSRRQVVAIDSRFWHLFTCWGRIWSGTLHGTGLL